MNRRQYLAASSGALALLSGCSGLPSLQDSAPPDGVPRRVSVLRQDDLGDDAIVDLSVAVVEPAVTREHTALLEFTMTYHGDEPVEWIFGSPAPYNLPKRSAEDTPGLLLVSSETATPNYPERVAETCWEPTGDVNEGATGTRFKLEPGESTSNRGTVWGDQREEGCMPPGDYRFDTTYQFDPPLTWSFTLRVTNPEDTSSGG